MEKLLAILGVYILLCSLSHSAYGEKDNKPCMGLIHPRGTCDSLEVPLDRSGTTKEKISIQFMKIAAKVPSNNNTPLVLLAGGPGQAGIKTYFPILRIFEEYNKENDILLFDQRGTGQSHPIKCENVRKMTTEEEIRLNTKQQNTQLMLDCLAALRKSYQLDKFITDIAAADLKEVLTTLGYNRVNLYGGSYGTRFAERFMQLYPQSVSRVVLEGFAGTALTIFEDFANDAQRALDLLFERCDKDPLCSKQFPDFRDDFYQVYNGLASPKMVTYISPKDGKTYKSELNQFVYSRMIFGMLYSPMITSLLPFAVHKVIKEGDYQGLVNISYSNDSDIYLGMLYSVVCSEDYPFVKDKNPARIDSSNIFADTFEIKAICKDWPRSKVADDFRSLKPQEIPTLIVSGNADPVTPPHYAKKLTESNKNVEHLILDNFGHNVLGEKCIQKIYQRFLLGEKEYKLKCLDQLKPLPFFMNNLGPLAND